MLVACFVFRQIAIACERARLPHLWGEPFVVVNEADSIEAASEETACFGIVPGQAVTGARSLCRGLIVLPYDRDAYLEAMHCVWDLFAIESSFVEPVSPEICYVALSGKAILARAQDLAVSLASVVRVSVQVGLARTRIVAYHAALRAEPRTILNVDIGREAALLHDVPLQAAARLDRKLVQRLERLGVRTLGDVLALPPHELHRQTKQLGWLLRRLALGEDGEQVRAAWPPRAIRAAREFEDETCCRETIIYALQECAGEIAAGLAREREYCRSLGVVIDFADRTVLEEREKLAAPLNLAAPLLVAAKRLLGRMRIEQPVARIELTAHNPGVPGGVQLALFDSNSQGCELPHERRERLEAALRVIRRKYGFGAVVSGTLLSKARRIHLWTHTLTRLASESVQVSVNGQGVPVRFYRRGRRYEVARIQNRWKETERIWNQTTDRTAYRIETDPGGLYELHQVGVQWRLNGIAD